MTCVHPMVMSQSLVGGCNVDATPAAGQHRRLAGRPPAAMLRSRNRSAGGITAAVALALQSGRRNELPRRHRRIEHGRGAQRLHDLGQTGAHAPRGAGEIGGRRCSSLRLEAAEWRWRWRVRRQPSAGHHAEAVGRARHDLDVPLRAPGTNSANGGRGVGYRALKRLVRQRWQGFR